MLAWALYCAVDINDMMVDLPNRVMGPGDHDSRLRSHGSGTNALVRTGCKRAPRHSLSPLGPINITTHPHCQNMSVLFPFRSCASGPLQEGHARHRTRRQPTGRNLASFQSVSQSISRTVAGIQWVQAECPMPLCAVDGQIVRLGALAACLIGNSLRPSTVPLR